MKTEKRTKTTTYDVYVAADGRTFLDKSECEIYEKTARCAILTMYETLVVGHSDEDAVFGAGISDNVIDFVKIDSQEAVEIIMKAWFYFNEFEEADSPRTVNFKKHVDIALRDGDVLLCGRGYENDDIWAYGTTGEIRQNFDLAVKNAING